MSKKTAVILILVMLVNSFTSCASTKDANTDVNPEEKRKSDEVTAMLIGIPLGFLAAAGLVYLLIDPFTEEPPLKTFGGACAITGILLGVGLLFGPFLLAEADSPDDGIKMASMESEESTNTSGNNLLNVLQHVEVGTTQNNDLYLGLRFRY